MSKPFALCRTRLKPYELSLSLPSSALVGGKKVFDGKGGEFLYAIDDFNDKSIRVGDAYTFSASWFIYVMQVRCAFRLRKNIKILF